MNMYEFYLSFVWSIVLTIIIIISIINEIKVNTNDNYSRKNLINNLQKHWNQ